MRLFLVKNVELWLIIRGLLVNTMKKEDDNEPEKDMEMLARMEDNASIMRDSKSREH